MDFTIELANGWTIELPYLEDRETNDEGFFVTVRDEHGAEQGHWVIEEFRDDPALCIGAFLGQAQSKLKNPR